MGRWQVIWWHHWLGFRDIGPYPRRGGRTIYDLRLALGFIEVRRLAHAQPVLPRRRPQ